MPRIPKYRLHKPSGRAVLQFKPLFGDRRVYLDGKFGSAESKAHYRRLLAEITAHMGKPDAPAPIRRNAEVGDVLTRFLDHATEYYGAGSKEFGHYKIASRFVYRAFSRLPVADFGPLRLEAVRESMIDAGWSRQHINKQVNRVRRIFRWGVSREIVPEAVYSALKTLDPLAKGKTRAPEAAPVTPVTREAVERVLPYLSPTVRAMVEVQYLTGMRSDELVGLRRQFIALGGEAWVYQPPDHKNAWRGQRKLICIGPETQRLIEPYLGDDHSEPAFSPRRAMSEQKAARKAARRTKAYGKAAAAKVKERPLADEYTAHAYQAAIIHGFKKLARSILLPQRPADVTPREWSKRCKKPKGVELEKWLADLGIEYWHPHQLRHTRATLTREKYGIEGAQAQLGNTLEAAEIYAEKSLELALKIARETG